jgi:2-polyprenyl-6-methoxyphenol hydroxylase-like FAD-dependent oxidoreductase
MGRSVLISGCGIAGPALAYWLLRHGLVPTVVERSPHLRTGGYIIDFWGAGYDLVERMGLLPEILAAGYHVREVRLVNRVGRRVGKFDADVFRRATIGRFTSVPRGDLAAILHRAVAARAETIFGNAVTALDEDTDGVRVTFERAAPRRFDLVVGADGLHSVVRALAFGAEARCERFLGYTVAAFRALGYRPRDEDVYLTYARPGREVMRFSMRDDATMIMFVASEAGAPPSGLDDPTAQKAYLRDRFEGPDWELPQIFAALGACTDLYFDRVSQIRMDRWTKGRVALVGDAAYAPSLLAGQGAALAIVGAYVLAGEVARAAAGTAGLEQALGRYESALRPFMLAKQDAAARLAGSFAPRTRLGIFLRNQITRALRLRFVARRAFGSALIDKIDLPDYPDPGPGAPNAATAPPG